jgi:hypothetical protein
MVAIQFDFAGFEGRGKGYEGHEVALKFRQGDSAAIIDANPYLGHKERSVMISTSTIRICMTGSASRYILFVFFLCVAAGAASSQTKAPSKSTAGQSTPSVAKDGKESATQVADKFLGGVKIIELPEGKKLVSETMWPIRMKVNRSSPVFNQYVTVYEGTFDTDVSGIQGYKRLVDIEGRSEAGTTLTTRFMLILYQNRTDQRWRVITFAKSQDPDEAVDYFRKTANQEKENKGWNQYILGLSLIDAGKLSEARETFNKALSLAETEDATKILNVPKDEVRDYLVALQSITGE